MTDAQLRELQGYLDALEQHLTDNPEEPSE